jgi:hypothetical protein
MKFGEKLKESWEGDFTTPPVLHMEIYTLEKLAFDLDSISPIKLIETLKENNIKVTGINQTLKDVAAENKLTPSAVYELLSAKYKKHSGPAAGEVPQGIGKFAVGSTAKSSGKDPQLLIKILKDKGIEADETTTLRSIADKMGLTPRDVYNFLVIK